MTGADPVGPAGVVRRNRFPSADTSPTIVLDAVWKSDTGMAELNSWPALTSTAIILPSGAR